MPPKVLPDLCFSLFGSTSMSYGGASLEVNRRQNRAILYRLAAQSHPVPRAHLAFLFWPDQADDRSRRLLTQLLSHIRHLLPDPDLLIATPERIQLDPNRLWSNVATFQALCRNVTAAPADDLRQAATLYEGPFLDGFSIPEYPEFDNWIAGERLRLEGLYLDALRRLIDLSTTQGQHRSAIEYAKSYLATDRVAEEIHCQLMLSYAAVGERSAALMQYATCVRTLEQELGISPLATTNAVYERIRAGTMP